MSAIHYCIIFFIVFITHYLFLLCNRFPFLQIDLFAPSCLVNLLLALPLVFLFIVAFAGAPTASKQTWSTSFMGAGTVVSAMAPIDKENSMVLMPPSFGVVVAPCAQTQSSDALSKLFVDSGAGTGSGSGTQATSASASSGTSTISSYDCMASTNGESRSAILAQTQVTQRPAPSASMTAESGTIDFESTFVYSHFLLKFCNFIFFLLYSIILHLKFSFY